MMFQNIFKTKNRIYKSAAVILSACIFTSAFSGIFSFDSYAKLSYDPLTGVPEGITAEKWAALNDKTIEWDEIEDIVAYKNPTYTTYYESASASVIMMKEGYSNFVGDSLETLDTINSTLTSLKAAEKEFLSSTESTVEYNGQSMSREDALKAIETAISASVSGKSALTSSLGSTSRSLSRAGDRVNVALKPLKRNMTSVLEGLFISYKTLEINREMVYQQKELYASMLKTYQGMQSQGLATSAQVSAYQTQLDSAESTLATLDAGFNQLRSSLLVQCGYSADDTEVVLGDAPKADRNFLSTRDYAADKDLAVNSNTEMIDDYIPEVKNSYGFEIRDAAMNETGASLSSQMDNIKAEVEQRVIECEQADNYQRMAEIVSGGADKKFSLGMISNAEYEGLKMQYISYSASAKLAELNLLQAIENYKFAVRGNLTAD